MLEPGSVLQGRYAITERIAAGGMGEVYKALDRQLADFEVAVKRLIVPSNQEGRRDLFIQQFTREALILRGLKHDNIPRLYACFEEGGDYFLVMDFIAGVPMSRCFTDGRPSLETVIDWTRQVASALEYLHGQTPHPVVYKDLKPDNLMVTPEGRVMLLDFGLAKGRRAEEAGTMFKGAGTLAYAAPEQLEGGEASTDARSDLYSLGATMFSLLTTRLPPSSLARLQARAAGRPDPMSLDAVPDPLRAVVSRLLALEPGERFQRAADVLGVLEAAAAPSVSVAAPMLGAPPVSVPAPVFDAPPPVSGAAPMLHVPPVTGAGGRSLRAPAARPLVIATPAPAEGAPPSLIAPVAWVASPAAPAPPVASPAAPGPTGVPVVGAVTAPVSLAADELDAAYAQTVVPDFPPAGSLDSKGLRGFKGAAPKRLDDAESALAPPPPAEAVLPLPPADTAPQAETAPPAEPQKKKGWLW